MRTILTTLAVVALLAFAAPASACDYGVGAFQAYRSLQFGGCHPAPAFVGYGYATPLQFGGYAAQARFGGFYGSQFRLGFGAGHVAPRAFVQPFHGRQIIRERAIIRGY